MIRQDYTQCHYDNCVYFQQYEGSFVCLLLYVDEMLIASKDKPLINKLKSQFSDEFEMKDPSSVQKILGMGIHRDRRADKLYLSQKKYFGKVLDMFNMSDCKSVSIPLAAHSNCHLILVQQRKRKLRRCFVFHILVQMVASCMLWYALNLIYPMRLVL